MHIMIATTGVLAPEPVADIVARLVGIDGSVSVITVIQVPRTFLDDIGSEEWRPLTEGTPGWSEQQDAMIARYVEERGRKLTEPVLSALEARGLRPQAHYLEGEDKAETILKAAENLRADLVVLGATRQIFAETSWESISARVMRDAHRPVLVMPAMRSVPAEEDEDV